MVRPSRGTGNTARRKWLGILDVMPFELCRFCAGLQTGALDIVATGQLVVAVYDRHPINRGHVLVIPTRHAPDLSSLTRDELVEVAIVAQRVDRALRDVLGVEVEGTNLHMSNGSSAGQDVMHAHLHVIPRSVGDGLELREGLSRFPPPPLTRDERSAIAVAISD